MSRFYVTACRSAIRDARCDRQRVCKHRDAGVRDISHISMYVSTEDMSIGSYSVIYFLPTGLTTVSGIMYLYNIYIVPGIIYIQYNTW